jgi:hypothetical protein
MKTYKEITESRGLQDRSTDTATLITDVMELTDYGSIISKAMNAANLPGDADHKAIKDGVKKRLAKYFR